MGVTVANNVSNSIDLRRGYHIYIYINVNMDRHVCLYMNLYMYKHE